MIPLPDDFLLEYTMRNIAWLKAHPEFLDHIFYTARRETVTKIEAFLAENSIHVTLGYPRDATVLPAFVIVMAPEEEDPHGIGDQLGAFQEFYRGTPMYEQPGPDLPPEEQAVVDYAEDILADHLESTGMRATYRIECWAANADMVTFMYAILKWSTWACRRDMYRLNWVNVLLSGIDLEPMTEYKPNFIYRRALQISMEYENVYYTDLASICKYGDMLRNPSKYTEDPEVAGGPDSWKLCPHYYSHEISGYTI